MTERNFSPHRDLNYNPLEPKASVLLICNFDPLFNAVSLELQTSTFQAEGQTSNKVFIEMIHSDFTSGLFPKRKTVQERAQAVVS